MEYNVSMNKRCNNIKAVIFDVDGVIFDTESVWSESFKRANKKLGVYISEEFRRTCSGIPLAVNKERIRAAFPDVDADEYMTAASEYYNEVVDEYSGLLKNGFVELIEFLKAKKLKLAVCTGGRREKLDFLFSKVNLDYRKIFDVIVTSDCCKRSKPDPMPYLLACEMLGESPSDCLVIEDSINGIQSAFSAGAIPVMVIDLILPDKKTKEKCFKVFKSLNEIKTII